MRYVGLEGSASFGNAAQMVIVIQAADRLLETERDGLVPTAPDAGVMLMRCRNLLSITTICTSCHRGPMVRLERTHGQLHETIIDELMVL